MENEYTFSVFCNGISIKSPQILSLPSLRVLPFQFYIPHSEKKSRITLKMSEVKQNEVHNKGKMHIDLSIRGEQEVYIFNSQGK